MKLHNGTTLQTMSRRHDEMVRLRARLKELQDQEELESSGISPQATPPDRKRSRVAMSPLLAVQGDPIGRRFSLDKCSTGPNKPPSPGAQLLRAAYSDRPVQSPLRLALSIEKLSLSHTNRSTSNFAKGCMSPSLLLDAVESDDGLDDGFDDASHDASHDSIESFSSDEPHSNGPSNGSSFGPSKGSSFGPSKGSRKKRGQALSFEDSEDSYDSDDDGLTSGKGRGASGKSRASGKRVRVSGSRHGSASGKATYQTFMTGNTTCTSGKQNTNTSCNQHDTSGNQNSTNEGVVRGNEGVVRSHGRDRGNARAQVRGNYTSHEVSTHSHEPVVGTTASVMGTTAPVMGTTAPVMGTQLLYAPTWAEDFESFAVGKAPGTIRKYQRHFDVLVKMLEKHQLYNTPPNHIDTRHLKELAISAKEDASSENVARDRIGFIMNFWNYLYTEEKVDRDRGTVLKKLKPKKQPTQMVERNITREECELMYTTAKGLGPYDTALFICTYSAGQRRFEAAKLRADECTYNDDKTINLRFKGKGGKVRTVPLSIEATRDIEPFLKAALTESGQANGGWLFPGAIKGQHICNDTVYNHIKKLGKLSGLDEKYGCNITTHWMRHGFGSHAIQGGADPATVSKQMGHASIATTSQYTHANKNKATSDYLEFTAEERKERKERTERKKKKKEEERDGPLILWRTNYIKLKREEAKQRYKQLKQEGADDEMVAQAKASYKSFPKH